MTAVSLQSIEKRYGSVPVCRVDRLDISDGEVLTLLGPSGCGKTTTLRIIAGLVAQDSGELYFGERNVTDVPPERRKMAMVFQNYALWPHMTVAREHRVRPRVATTPKNEIRDACEAAMEPSICRIWGTISARAQRRPAAARLGRASARSRARVLLLDEPLSNLDAKLREQMRSSSKLLDAACDHRVYVTHDQDEAMVVSDRIAVMDKGEVVRIDTPHNIYRDPQSRFVADFLGLSSFIPAKVARWDQEKRCGTLVTEDGLEIAGVGAARSGEEVLLCVRPENVALAAADVAAGSGVNRFIGTVVTAADLGEFIDYQINVGKWQLRTKALSGRPGVPHRRTSRGVARP